MSPFLAQSSPNPWHFLSPEHYQGVFCYVSEITLGKHPGIWTRCQWSPPLVTGWKLAVPPLISREDRRAWGWINCQWQWLPPLWPCDEPSIKPTKYSSFAAFFFRELPRWETRMLCHYDEPRVPQGEHLLELHWGPGPMYLSSSGCWFTSLICFLINR